MNPASELQDLIREIRQKVRARHAASGSGDLRVPDLTPILHARDSAFGKVASIGRVNPRPGGAVNAAIQAVKRLVSRLLDWHVREQIEFNRAAIASTEAILAALEENNRVLRELGSRLAAVESARQATEVQLRDTVSHWIAWRSEWERKLAANETQFLRGVADLQAAFQHRVTLMDGSHREAMAAQHRDFEGALARAAEQIQQKLWSDLERIRREYESLIHVELRMLRQRAALGAAPPPAPGAPPPLDYWHFQSKFRGPEEYVRKNQQFYLSCFAGREVVLDLGCGRGEFLELMREHGVAARGVDSNAEFVALCRSKGLDVEQGDLFSALDALPDKSLDGLFCSQVVEHLPPQRVPELIGLAASKLRTGGVLAVETPNPECLAIFATHFYLDPTHTRPIPPPLLAFYFEEAGFGRLSIQRFAPAAESMPAVNDLPPGFRDTFFGALDYAVIGYRLT